MAIKLDYVYYNWVKIHLQCLELAGKIKNDVFLPDILIGLARGGLIISRLLSDLLKVKQIGTLQLEYYKSLDQKKTVPNLISDISCEVSQKNILLCDDLVDTGESIIYVLNYFRNRDCKNIKVATLHKKPYSKIIPDYFIEEVNAWIIYPWELMETINAFQKILKSKSIIEKKLFELGIEKNLIKKLLDFK